MKTDDLIKALAADAPTRQMPIGRAFALALMAGIAATAALFFWKFGIRPGAAESLSTIRFPFKFVLTLSLTVPALLGLYRLSRPNGELGSLSIALVVAPVLLALAVAFELVTVPKELWGPRLIGHNSMVCLQVVPLLALAPLAAAIAALRYGATSHPRLAATMAGLAAAGISMTLYAATCPDDSPLFLATWYTIATAIVVVASLLVAPRIIRW